MKLHSSLRAFRTVIMGAPGSGKGTISSRLKKDFSLVYISSGDLLRRNIIKRTEYGKIANSFVVDGRLVPREIVEKLVLDEAKKHPTKHILLDGYPRNVGQATELAKQLEVNCVLYLDVMFEEIIERITGRWLHPSSGRVYHTTFNPPKMQGIDDVTGESLIQREDDKPHTVQKRLETYEKTAKPLIEFYKNLGLLHTFTGRYSNELWPRIFDTFSQFVPPLQYTKYT